MFEIFVHLLSNSKILNSCVNKKILTQNYFKNKILTFPPEFKPVKHTKKISSPM